MNFEELKEVFVDTLSCDADKVTMEASLTEDLQADSLDAVNPAKAMSAPTNATPLYPTRKSAGRSVFRTTATFTAYSAGRPA